MHQKIINEYRQLQQNNIRLDSSERHLSDQNDDKPKNKKRPRTRTKSKKRAKFEDCDINDDDDAEPNLHERQSVVAHKRPSTPEVQPR